jgi:hypothetical protein
MLRNCKAPFFVALWALLALSADGCSNSSSDSGSATKLPPTPRVTGLLLDYTDTLQSAVPVSILGSSISGRTTIDGRVLLGAAPASGARVLRVGDSVDTPTLLIPYTATNDLYLDRPVHLPHLSSGIQSSVPTPLTGNTTLTSTNLPGVSLALTTGTTITGPYAGSLAVVAVSPSRLPASIGAGIGEPRAAYLVEPSGVTFSNSAVLTVPRLDSGAGPFDAYRVSLSTGQWVLAESNVTTTANDYVLSIVNTGTMWCVVPQTAPATVTVTGRIVAGTQPVAGYVASCWNRSSAPTAADGAFKIENVPSSFGAYLVRVQPSRPGVDFDPEVVTAISINSALGSDISVTARVPDRIRPTVVSTNPAAGKTSISRSTQITVTFSEPIDRSLAKPFKVLGLNGDVAGQYSYDNAFTARFRPQLNLGPSEDVFIVVDADVQDLSGNDLIADTVSFKFTTKGGAPDPPPTDTLAFGLAPLSGIVGDSVSISGRNYTGGTTVKFGSTTALVPQETTDTVAATVPDFEPAGDVTVSLSAAGTAISTLQPLVFDLRATVSTIFNDLVSSTPLTFVDRAAPPTNLLIDASNSGNTSVTIDGVSQSASNFQETVGAVLVTTGRQITLPTPASATLLTGPVVLRGSNGKAGATYRFLHVRD